MAFPVTRFTSTWLARTRSTRFLSMVALPPLGNVLLKRNAHEHHKTGYDGWKIICRRLRKKLILRACYRPERHQLNWRSLLGSERGDPARMGYPCQAAAQATKVWGLGADSSTRFDPASSSRPLSISCRGVAPCHSLTGCVYRARPACFLRNS